MTVPFHLLQNFRETIERQLGGYEAPIPESHVNPDDSQATLPNGQTEGQINRLKTLKRAMYGRAGVELLRARMMPL